MKSRLHNRVAKLEAKRRPAPELFMFWRFPGETEEELIAEEFPDGPPENARFMFISWPEIDPGARSGSGDTSYAHRRAMIRRRRMGLSQSAVDEHVPDIPDAADRASPQLRRESGDRARAFPPRPRRGRGSG